MVQDAVDSLVTVAMGGGAEGVGGGYMVWVMLLVLGAIWYLLLIRPQQKQQQEHDEMVQSLEKGDRVVTAGGIHGQIVSLSDETVKINVAKDIKLTVNRSSIASRKDSGGEG